MKKPNIIFLMVDQQNKTVFDDNNICKTPNINNLMKDSIRFNNTHCVNAVCSPSRASLITGMYPHNHGMIDCSHTVPEHRAKYDQSLDNLPIALSDEGYVTSYYGKWHIERSMKLENFGFSDYLNEYNMPKFDVTPIEKVIVKSEGYMDKTICGVFKEGIEKTEENFIYEKGIDFIKNHKDGDKPFCTFLSTYAPHDPYVVSKEIYDLYDLDDIELPVSFNDDLQNRPNVYKRISSVWENMSELDYKKTMACYYGYTTLVDMQVGKLVKFLKEENLYDETIIVFTTDHGDMLASHGMFCKGITPFEEVYHIPFTVKPHTSQLKDIDCDVHVSTIDMAPTLLELAKLRPLKGNIDGESVVSYINSDKSNDKVSYAEFFGQRYAYTQKIIWKDHYKFVFNGFDYDEFYDLEKDPFELVNEINNPKYKELVIELTREMWKKIKESNDDTMLNAEYVMLRFAEIGPEKTQSTGDFSIYNKPF
jgi:arylsulfatase A-like enzyme